MLKLKLALVIGKASLRLPARQALSWLRRLGAKGALPVRDSVFEPVALDLADTLIPDAGLGRLGGPLPQRLDYVGRGLDPRGRASSPKVVRSR
jgi:hypothetical protein